MAAARFQIGRALRQRNYRLFFAGQSTSLIGTWLTKFATSWMAYRLTGYTLCVAGVACIACGALFHRALPRLRTESRPLYLQLGLLD